MIKSPAVLLHLTRDVNYCFVQWLHAKGSWPVSHLVALSVIRSAGWEWQSLRSVTLMLLSEGPKHKSSAAGHLDLPQRSGKVPPLSEKVNLSLIKHLVISHHHQRKGEHSTRRDFERETTFRLVILYYDIIIVLF